MAEIRSMRVMAYCAAIMADVAHASNDAGPRIERVMARGGTATLLFFSESTKLAISATFFPRKRFLKKYNRLAGRKRLIGLL